MIKKLKAMMLNPGRLMVQNAVQVFGDYESKLKFGAVPRAQYGFCLYNAARLANKLGYKHISAIEFGVAGGNCQGRWITGIYRITGRKVFIKWISRRLSRDLQRPN